MQKETLYLKLERNVELPSEEVCMKDLGKFYCRSEQILARIKGMKVCRFRDKDGGRRVISALYVIRLLQREFPNLEIENIGEAQVVAELVRVDKRPGILQYGKILFVCGICFFGAAFTIMAFHNDIGIREVFAQVYRLISGEQKQGITILELSYSVGLALGIIVFFNHIGGRRITKDPTPIEVEMRNYEDDVNNALAETADREKKTLDVE